MALIICPECGKEISDTVTACPNCGCPIAKIQLAGYKHLPTLPRVFTIVGIVIFSLILLVASVSLFEPELMADDEPMSNLECVYYGVMSTLFLISFVGILNVKMWGLKLNICLVVFDLLINVIFWDYFNMTWEQLVFDILLPVAFYCTFLASYNGVNAFAMMKNDGKVVAKQN